MRRRHNWRGENCTPDDLGALGRDQERLITKKKYRPCSKIDSPSVNGKSIIAFAASERGSTTYLPKSLGARLNKQRNLIPIGSAPMQQHVVFMQIRCSAVIYCGRSVSNAIRFEFLAATRKHVTYAKTIAPVDRQWNWSSGCRAHIISTHSKAVIFIFSEISAAWHWRAIAQGDAGARKDVSLDTWLCEMNGTQVGRRSTTDLWLRFSLSNLPARFVVVFGAGFACASRLAPNARLSDRAPSHSPKSARPDSLTHSPAAPCTTLFIPSSEWFRAVRYVLISPIDLNESHA